MNINIDPSWLPYLGPEFAKPYFTELSSFVDRRYAATTVYPEEANIFRAFDACPFDKVRVVIIGQDPYHGAGQANGLSFSVGEGVRFPPSLRNIFREVVASTGAIFPDAGDLERWAAQGVLLLNSVLTVESGQAGSHQRQGWERFTDCAVAALSEHREGVVYMLWGKAAQNKGRMIDRSRNCVLDAAHPSPLSAYRGFMGCRHFAEANKYLSSRGGDSILW